MADLSLFDNITVDNHDRISKSDRERIDSLTESFHRTLTNLYDWRDIFTERLKNAPDTVVIRYNKVEDRGVTRYMSESTPEERMSALSFHPLYGLENVYKLAVRAALAYERQIVDHFRTTYKGDFEPKGVIRDALFGDIFEKRDSSELCRNKIAFDKLPELPQERRFPDAAPVIDHIIESLGGLSFKQKADKLTLNQFTKHFEYSKPAIKGCVITLGGFVYRGWLYDRDEINYEAVNNIDNMLETVMVCEDSDFKPAVTYDRYHIIWGSAYAVRNSGLLSDITLFKNGNLKMKFNSAAAAQRFYTFCFGPIQQENEK